MGDDGVVRSPDVLMPSVGSISPYLGAVICRIIVKMRKMKIISCCISVGGVVFIEVDHRSLTNLLPDIRGISARPSIYLGVPLELFGDGLFLIFSTLWDLRVRVMRPIVDHISIVW